MNTLRLLIVEDNEDDMNTCRETVKRYEADKDDKDDKGDKVELVECESVAEALQEFEKSNAFDGAIIDLKLGNEGNEGNQVINKIAESSFRIPIAVLTGTPNPVDSDVSYIKVFKKGDIGAGYKELLDRFWDIYNTGLTRIMGGRGIIEENLSKVFQDNLMPKKYRKKWIEYGKADSVRTEKALLRHTLNHLLQLLDNDEGRCFPEEVYLAPPLTDKIQTGNIVQRKDSDQRFAVMNPACDLAARKEGAINTDLILLVEIEKETVVVNTALNRNQRKSRLSEVRRNKLFYYHWLPKTDFFDGGFLNFRKLSTVTKEGYDQQFNKLEIQISPFFIKDMVARFSSYYARQGQPDIDDEFIKQHAPDLPENPG